MIRRLSPPSASSALGAEGLGSAMVFLGLAALPSFASAIVAKKTASVALGTLAGFVSVLGMSTIGTRSRS